MEGGGGGGANYIKKTKIIDKIKKTLKTDHNIGLTDLFIALNVTLYINEANSIKESKKQKYTILLFYLTFF